MPETTTSSTPSYHDLHITTARIARTRLFDLPHGLEVTCNRVGGWCLFDGRTQIATEYPLGEDWLVLDVAGHVIVDSRRAEVPDA